MIRTLGGLARRWECASLPASLQASDAPVEERRRARLFLWLVSVVPFGAVLVWTMNRSIGRPIDAAELVSEGTALALLGLLPLLRRGVPLPLLAQTLTTVLVAGLFVPVWTTQGRAPATMLLSLLPPMLVVMSGLRSALLWSAVVVCGLVGMAVASDLRPDHTISIPLRVQERWIFTIPCVFVVLGTTLIALLESNRNLAQAELESSRRAQQESEAQLRAIFEAAPVGIGLFDTRGSALEANRRGLAMLGLDGEGAVDVRVLRAAVHPEDRDRTNAYFGRVLSGAVQEPLVYRWTQPDGGVEWTETSASAVRDGDGRVRYFVATAQFVTERKAAEEKIKTLAFFDGITGLENRPLFVQRMQVALDLARREGHPLAVLFLDLDGFKQVNDRFGHDVGDEALAVVAHRFASCIRLSDGLGRIPDGLHVSRFGGDEFAVLLGEVDGHRGAEIAATRLISSLQEPIRTREHSLPMGVSIGIAVYPEDGETIEDLLRSADAAMYRAKSEPGSAYCFYRAVRGAASGDGVA